MDASGEKSSSSLLARYRELKHRVKSVQDPILPRPPGAIVEATEAQQELWLHGVLAGEAPLYNEPVTIYLDFEVNIAALERAFNYVVNRHEAWRTGFEWQDGKLLQVMYPDLFVRIPLLDVSGRTANKATRLALTNALFDAKSVIDMTRPPLFRILLVRLANSAYRLYLTLHHILFDGVALYQIFLPELQACYAAFLSGGHPNLPRLPIQYADYCWWRQNRPKQILSEEVLFYWRERLDNLANISLPLDRPRPAIRNFQGAMHSFSLEQEITVEIKSLGNASNATPNIVFLAAFYILLYQWTGECDQMIATVTCDRKYPETLPLLGFFLNTVLLRTVVRPEDTFQLLIEKVRDTMLGALSHEIPYTAILRLFAKERTAGLNPLFQTSFSLQPELPILGAGWNLTQMDVGTGTAKFDLSLEVDDRRDGLIGRFIYSTEIFDEATIRDLANRWIELLRLIAEDPGCSVEKFAFKLSSRNRSRTGNRSRIWPTWVPRTWLRRRNRSRGGFKHGRF